MSGTSRVVKYFHLARCNDVKVVTLNDVKMGIAKNPWGGLLKGNAEDVLWFGVHHKHLVT